MLTTPPIYERGIALYDSGAVRKTTTKGLFMVQQTSGDGSYRVDTRLDHPCQCDYAVHNPDMVCKHTVAALRKMLDDLMYAVSA